MFKVLYAPFGPEVRNADPRAHSILVWQVPKGTRIFCQNIASDPESRARLDWRCETTAECLNYPPSLAPLEFVKEMLRSITYTIRLGEMDRRERMRPKPFFHSFKGHGGTGVDGYW